MDYGPICLVLDFKATPFRCCFLVTCFQWALMLKPANIVLPIVATTPLVVLPMAHFFEGERVSCRAVLGSAIAVAGVVGLVQVT